MLVNNLCEGTRKEFLEFLDEEILNEGIVNYTGECFCLEEDGKGHSEYYFDLYTMDGKLYEVMYYKGKIKHKLEWTDKSRKDERLKLMFARVDKFGLYEEVK